ncbi:hypothetical protein SAMN04487866_10289 [Thermoactinomyces sp. DSM 45891]|uniref:ThuA domain-containing protein n=1 Tax=Thermoactinomyces sp. DSM 45891 TaxID=1761907 RepID=UPI0009153AF2|nr:ThuA domain-containing protein [Thermoactinomyces sp. DSM 45891]SFX19109.1 hypothetical protein SAMN04487866_10289 [Thermoactinomyces sp. DSM 45891]
MKAIVLGQYEGAQYHPFTSIDHELQSIFEGVMDVECTDDYAVLRDDKLTNYDLFISYTEFSDLEITEEQAQALISYVRGGGGLLVIHNGISLQQNKELEKLIGGRVTGHPEYTSLPIRYIQGSHPIVENLSDFLIDEEPFRYELSPHESTVILAEYEHDDKRWPAAWAHTYGSGRVVNLMPGHHLPSFQVEPARKLIRNSGMWAGGGFVE